jgi:hypothetical protein
MLENSARCVYTVEKYVPLRCHIGSNNDFTIVSTPSTLRTKILLKGEGMLGSYPILPTYG